MVFLTLGEIDFQKECFSTAFEEIPISFASEVALSLSFSNSQRMIFSPPFAILASLYSVFCLIN